MVWYRDYPHYTQHWTHVIPSVRRGRPVRACRGVVHLDWRHSRRAPLSRQTTLHSPSWPPPPEEQPCTAGWLWGGERCDSKERCQCVWTKTVVAMTADQWSTSNLSSTHVPLLQLQNVGIISDQAQRLQHYICCYSSEIVSDASDVTE